MTGEQANIIISFKTRVVSHIRLRHLRPYEVGRHFTLSVHSASQVHWFLWKYITCYFIRTASLQCMPLLRIPRSLKRSRPDAACWSVVPNLQSFFFAMQFIWFDLQQIHIHYECNHFNKKNDWNKHTAVNQTLHWSSGCCSSDCSWFPQILVCRKFQQFQYFACKHNFTVTVIKLANVSLCY